MSKLIIILLVLLTSLKLGEIAFMVGHGNPGLHREYHIPFGKILPNGTRHILIVEIRLLGLSRIKLLNWKNYMKFISERYSSDLTK